MFNYEVYQNNCKVYSEKHLKNKEVFNFLSVILERNKEKNHYFYIDEVQKSDYSFDDITYISVKDYFDKSIKYVFNKVGKPTK